MGVLCQPHQLLDSVCVSENMNQRSISQNAQREPVRMSATMVLLWLCFWAVMCHLVKGIGSSYLSNLQDIISANFTLLETYHGDNPFIFLCCDFQESGRNTSLMQQNNLPGMCAFYRPMLHFALRYSKIWVRLLGVQTENKLKFKRITQLVWFLLLFKPLPVLLLLHLTNSTTRCDVNLDSPVD